MQTKKMSLANIKGKLSRAEMKVIMAGSGGSCTVINGPRCAPGMCPNMCRDIDFGVICCG